MSELFDVFFRCFAIPLDLYLDPFVVFPNTKKKAQTILVTILVPHWQFALFILVFGTCRLWTLNINTFYPDRYNQGRSSKNDGSPSSQTPIQQNIFPKLMSQEDLIT